MQIQIDNRRTPSEVSPLKCRWENIASRIPAGKEVTVVAGETISIKISASQVTEMVRAGRRGVFARDYRKARKLLEKASTLCSRKKEEKTVCSSVGYELSFLEGQTYEAQEAWAQAMTESTTRSSSRASSAR